MASAPQLISLPSSLEDAKVKSLPSSAFYIADFITEKEEQTLLNKIESAPKPRWKQLSKRRLQTWPSDLTKNALLSSPLPPWLQQPIIARLLSCPISPTDEDKHIFSDSPHKSPNHVLINEYMPGQGIMPHKDGSAYHPVVCTISLGASIVLDIFGTNEDGTTESEPRWKIFQEPRSLLITSGDLYSDYLHGIAEIKEDSNLGQETVSNWNLMRSTEEILDGKYQRKTRTSLTYRDVIKVSNLGEKLGMFGKH